MIQFDFPPSLLVVFRRLAALCSWLFLLPFFPSQIFKIILSMLRIELEKFFCFTSNFKLEQKVTVEPKVFKESLAKTGCV